MRPRLPIDWEVVMFWLEMGEALPVIAAHFKVTPTTLSRRAKEELSSERHKIYHETAMANAHTAQMVDCGTNTGYHRHVRHKEEACAPCKAAHNRAAKLYRVSREDHEGMPEYKVDYRGFVKRYGKECWAVERHNTKGGVRLVATYTDKLKARDICEALNAEADAELG